ncbi:LrgB family protein [Gallalistipes aquisgranensis]|uniref:LrgB family protein n=1 Tax=Gallalistipes aquisgranensis TaxID=2779358 RepID=UPI001CF91465|nr:LrgB family protein [Gallalistipes aquisgranensis]MBE5034104.1 LrgB family protein [Gallalistipes aquisgranensis]
MTALLDGWISEPLFLLTLTVGVYWGAVTLYRRTGWSVLHPLLVSMVVIILFLKWTGVDYRAYYEANGIINFMLGLSVVALGYLLHENFEQIRGKELSILFSVFVGSVLGVVSVVLIARWLGAGHAIVASLQPKSVTTPIALAVSEHSGGIPALTSVAVIVAGIFGSIFGPWLLRTAGVKQSVARGLAMGAASHAMGTAKAMELGAVEGAIGGAAIGLMGVATSLVIPVIESVM